MLRWSNYEQRNQNHVTWDTAYDIAGFLVLLLQIPLFAEGLYGRSERKNRTYDETLHHHNDDAVHHAHGDDSLYCALSETKTIRIPEEVLLESTSFTFDRKN